MLYIPNSGERANIQFQKSSRWPKSSATNIRTLARAHPHTQLPTNFVTCGHRSIPDIPGHSQHSQSWPQVCCVSLLLRGESNIVCLLGVHKSSNNGQLKKDCRGVGKSICCGCQKLSSYSNNRRDSYMYVLKYHYISFMYNGIHI